MSIIKKAYIHENFFFSLFICECMCVYSYRYIVQKLLKRDAIYFLSLNIQSYVMPIANSHENEENLFRFFSVAVFILFLLLLRMMCGWLCRKMTSFGIGAGESLEILIVYIVSRKCFGLKRIIFRTKILFLRFKFNPWN